MSVAPIAGAGTAEECVVEKAPAVELLAGQLYFHMTYIQIPGSTNAEFWFEENGHPGLQIHSTSCGGTTIPADRALLWTSAADAYSLGHSAF